ncbi:hypothetical protein PMI02_05404 [Novosphingobium sp. AP12]|nr:hypothetical protein PMI02_05404 [Novosphingobium sp. AP12]
MSEDSSGMNGGKGLDGMTVRWLASSAILAAGLVVGGFALGDGIKRA